VNGTLQASYDNNAFTAQYGYATTYTDAQGASEGLIAGGDGPLHCGSEKSPNPPSGDGVIIAIPALASGHYDPASVTMYRNVSGFIAVGSTGTVDVVATSANVQATIAFNFTDTDGKVYSANGTFEVVVCPP
jgi:hypothetical protein